MKRFTNLYQLSKTLRFELKPIGKTLENIKKHGLLEQDTHRAESYVKVKEIIDKYHKNFIEECLNTFADSSKTYVEQNENFIKFLQEFYTNYMCKTKDETQQNLLTESQSKLRKIIAKSFNNEKYKRLFSEKLIKEDLISFVKDNVEDIALVQEFKDFTTYFNGFNENRKNMYSDKAKSTGIAYRLIHENLPRFIDNILVFEKIANSDVAQKFTDLYKNFESYLNVNEISEMFKLDYYNMVLTQTQIDAYNYIIGGLNEYINLYNQQQKDKHNRLPKPKALYKQILSDRNSIAWLSEQFDANEKGGKVLEAIQTAYNELEQQILNNSNEAEHSLPELLNSLSNFDLNKVYIPNDTQLTAISQKVYGHWNIISKALLEDLKLTTPRKSRKETDEKYEERLNKILKSQSSFSIRKITDSVHNTYPEIKSSIITYFENIGNIDNEEENIISKITNTYNIAKDLLNTPYTGNNLSQDTINVEKIKNLLDAIKDLQHFIKPLLGKGDESEKDEKFYGEFILLWDELNNITPLYNMVRNYMTRKPYYTEKIKLNFENKGNFLGGWVDSKTENSDNGTQYGGYIFRKKNMLKEYDYYLGVSSNVHLFRRDTIIDSSDISEYERLDYYQLKSQTIYGVAYQGNYQEESRQIIKAIEAAINEFGNNEIKVKIEKEQEKNNPRTNTAKGYLSFIKENDFQIYNIIINAQSFKTANQQLIDSIKNTLYSFNRVPKAQILTEKEYSLFCDLMNDIDELVKEKVFNYIPISNNEFITALETSIKPMYLFKISNKDLSYADSFEKGIRKSRGTENLHTLYFKALMEGELNIIDIGTGSIFYRKGELKYTEEKLKNGHHAEILKDKFPYPIIKDKRYVYDKFLLHLSIVQNYKYPKADKVDINNKVREYIKENNNLHIIGIDRGERHLLYLTVINLQGNIKEQYSLNEIINNYNGNTYKTNYHDLLTDREEKRKKERPSWKSIENIKDLKEGYLRQEIHKITELMVKYNAIVVLEDLNIAFKGSRQKIEASVYQKFEKMLIDKLNYLVDKKKLPKETGGILNALQLSNDFNQNNIDKSKQSGFLFYTQAWNTSKIDPVTGFVNLFNTHYETREKSQDFFKKFDSICYNAKQDWFEFSFDYNNFTTKAEGTRTNWTLCTYGKRIETFRDEKQNSQWASNEINLTDKFKEFFAKHNIKLNDSLKESIVAQDSAEFFKGLFSLLKLTLQLRNSEINSEVDYLQSPVADNNGVFFNSQECDNSLPQNADANGAYNIARKGLWIVNQIKNSSDVSKVKLAIPNKEWLQFAQEKPYLLND